MELAMIVLIGLVLTVWITIKNLQDGTQGDDK